MLMDVRNWYRRNVEIHGMAMILLAGFIYLSQGSRGYIIAAYSWLIQYEFGLEPSAAASGKAIGALPWSFKFVIGLVSDNLPIMGYNAKPYMIFASVCGALAIAAQGLQFVTPNSSTLTAAYITMRFYGAFVDCLGDSLIIKSGRQDEEDSTSGLQSISWFMLGVGGALFTIMGSQMSTDENAPSGVSTTGARAYNLIMTVFPVMLVILLFFVKEEKSTVRPGFRALMQQLVRLFVVFFSPPFLVIRVALWIVISGASLINLSEGMLLFKTTEIEIPPSVQGWVDVISYAFLSFGVVIYYRFFRHTSFRSIFAGTQIFFAIAYLFDYVLVKRLNTKWGIPDVVFMIGSDSFATVIDRLNSMPFLVMAGQLCPENMEATFFALLMSISNLSSTFATAGGAIVLEQFEVKKGSYDGLATAILIRSGIILSVLLLILLLPDTSSLSPANVNSLHPTNPYIIKVLKFADMYHPNVDKAEKGETDAIEADVKKPAETVTKE